MENLDINFSEEQAMLMNTAQKFSRDNSSLDKVRELIETEKGFDQKVWQEMIQLGWAGIAIPEEFGGSGLNVGDLVPVFEGMGRHLVSAPLFTQILASQLLLAAGSPEQKSQWLPKIADGSIIASIAMTEMNGSWNSADIEASHSNGTLTGTKTSVLNGTDADLIISVVKETDGQLQLALLEKSAVAGKMQRETAIDETRRSFRLNLDGIQVAQSQLLNSGNVNDAIAQMSRTAWLLLSAEMAGGINGVMDVTVEYLKLRKQFGQPIGSYQGLKHPMANILVDLESSRSHCYHAASVVSDGPESETAEIAARMAISLASETFTYASDRAIQFHGGFGFTYDCDAQLFLRRARWCEFAFGDAQHHRKKLADLLL
ncbi:MAG: acyl-CoA/acyl-ACP dehydrogenase [Pseudomonadales bacterium]|nr:acyl-CoA/acyl-ACP dehydrogenase [Pseudomonadales bacterium]